MHWLLKCRLLCQFGGRVASHLISKLMRLKGRFLQIVLLGLALLVLQKRELQSDANKEVSLAHPFCQSYTALQKKDVVGKLLSWRQLEYKVLTTIMELYKYVPFFA